MALYLGYDGSCGTCGELARRIQTEVGENSLSVIPLNDPRMKEWRSRAFKGREVWKPTLVEVLDNDDVRAWTGVAMGWAITNRLGVRMTARLATLFGEFRAERLSRRREFKIARRPLAKFALGLAGSVAFLAGGTAPRAAAADRSRVAFNKKIVASTEVGYDSAVAAVVEHLDADSEAKALLDAAYGRTDASIHDIVPEPEFRRLYADMLVTAKNSEEALDLQSVNHRLEGAGSLKTYSIEIGSLLVVIYDAENDGRNNLSVRVFDIPGDDVDSFTLLASSVNGDKVVTLKNERSGDDAVVPVAAGCDQGECSSKGACYTCVCSSFDKKCVFNACGPCALTCNWYSPWQLCLACVAVWCPAALTVNECCTGAHCGWRESCA